MVRLKENAFFSKYSAFCEFQFHYGTIKRTVVSTIRQLSGYFNSTMVRLKVTYTEFSPYVIKDFNSTMVRLKEKLHGANINAI